MFLPTRVVALLLMMASSQKMQSFFQMFDSLGSVIMGICIMHVIGKSGWMRSRTSTKLIVSYYFYREMYCPKQSNKLYVN